MPKKYVKRKRSTRRLTKRRTPRRYSNAMEISGYGKYRKRRSTKKRSYKGRRRSIRGYGDYSGGGSTFAQGTSPPQVRNSKGGFVIRHREYIQDIQSSQAFVGVAGYINPGNSALFPWLSQVALNFEEWVPRGI